LLLLELALGIRTIGIHRLERITPGLLIGSQHVSIRILPINFRHTVIDIAVVVAQV
tara:strand:+ start:396 stop:563 length:168 start_codon:yes stop_codon:yes gene_type:complete